MQINISRPRTGVFCYHGATITQSRLCKLGLVVLLAASIIACFDFPHQNIVLWSLAGGGSIIIFSFRTTYSLFKKRYVEKFEEIKKAIISKNFFYLEATPHWQNALNWQGYPLLSIFLIEGNEEAVDFLLNHKANPNVADRRGITPIFYFILNAKLSKNFLLAQRLLAAGADIHHVFQKSFISIPTTPYEFVKNGKMPLLKIFDEHLAKLPNACFVNCPKDYQRTAKLLSSEQRKVLENYELDAGAWDFEAINIKQVALVELQKLPNKLASFLVPLAKPEQTQKAINAVQQMLAGYYIDPYGHSADKAWCQDACNMLCSIIDFANKSPDADLYREPVLDSLINCLHGSDTELTMLYLQGPGNIAPEKAKQFGSPSAKMRKKLQEFRRQARELSIVIVSDKRAWFTNLQSRHDYCRYCNLFDHSVFHLPTSPLIQKDQNYKGMGNRYKDALLIRDFYSRYNMYSIVDFLFNKKNASTLFTEWAERYLHKNPHKIIFDEASGELLFSLFPEFLVDLKILKRKPS